MAGKLGKLNVEIDATLSKYEAKLKQAERQAKKSGQAAGDSFGDSFSKSTTEKLSKAIASMGAVEAVVKAGSAAAKAFRGDWESAITTLESLPFGIGPVVGALKSLGMELSGINAEIEEFQKLNERVAAMAKGAQRSNTFRSGLASQAEGIENANRLAGLSGSARTSVLGEMAEEKIRAIRDNATRFKDANEDVERVVAAIRREQEMRVAADRKQRLDAEFHEARLADIRIKEQEAAEMKVARKREELRDREIAKRKEKLKSVQDRMKEGMAEFLQNIGSKTVSLSSSVFGQGGAGTPRVKVEGQNEVLKVLREIRELNRGPRAATPVAG